jgi:uncharacterized protein (TIGR02996 family)
MATSSDLGSATAPLLRAVLEHPDDVANRRVYADALVARDEPRGEFIQIQCDLAEPGERTSEVLTTLRLRANALLAKHEKAWTAPFAKTAASWRFRRGMIERVYSKSARLLTGIETLFAHEPVTEIATNGLTQAQAAELGGRSELARVRSLRVTESSLATKGATALFASPHLAALRELDLTRAGVDAGGLAGLRASTLEDLELLALSGNRVSPDELLSFIDGAPLERLRELRLAGLVPGSLGAAIAGSCAKAPLLETMDLASNHYSDENVASLVPALEKVRRLRLEQNSVGPKGVAALRALSGLEDLDLSTNPIALAGAEELARGPWPSLRRLDLMQANIGDEGIEALVDRGSFPRLDEIDVRYLKAGPRAAEALARAPWPLQSVDLWANAIGDDGARALANASWRKSIRCLVLAYNEIGDAGVAALAAAEWPALERLVLHGNEIGADGARALAASTGMPSLVELDLEKTNAPASELKALRKRLGSGLIR